MIPIALAIARYLGATGLVAAGLVLFYEGVPLGPVRYIPYVGPALEQFVDGRVDREARAAALAERLTWQEKERRARVDAEKREADLQTQLDEIAARYRDAQVDSVLQIIKLEEQLDKEAKDDAAAGRPPRVAIPRGVSRGLNDTGR